MTEMMEQQQQTEVEIERTESEISEEEENSFHDISLLLDHGVTTEDLKKLQDAGINTVKGIQMTIKKKLLSIGLSEEILTKIHDACSKIALNTVFLTATEVSNQRKQIFRLSTGSKNLDKLLGGGVEAMAITEVFGESRTGKTQLAHTLCVTAQMPGPNYIGGKVIFIDTEHTFRPDKLRIIAERFNIDQAAALDNILYARAYNSEHQYTLLNHIAAKLHEEAGLFKLLVIDSIMALFRVDFSGRGEIGDRQIKLAQMLSRLQKISEEYNIAVFVTNQITSDFTNTKNELKPIGGHIMAHSATNRVSLKKGDGPVRIAQMFDSPDLEDCECEFILTAGGIDDC